MSYVERVVHSCIYWREQVRIEKAEKDPTCFLYPVPVIMYQLEIGFSEMIYSYLMYLYTIYTPYSLFQETRDIGV